MKRRPKIFYKYCSPARIDILINGRIRFTQRDDLNDIHDMRPVKAFNEAGHLAERQKMAIRYPQMHNMPPITPEEFGQTIEKTLDEALVLCLSAKWDLVPM